MANTKNLTPEARKKTKRNQRRAIKDQFRALTKKEMKAFRKAHRTDKVNFLPWLREHEAEKAKA